MIYILTARLKKPSTSEIFLECDCVAQKRPIGLEKTKMQCSPRVLNFRCHWLCFTANFPEVLQLL